MVQDGEASVQWVVMGGWAWEGCRLPGSRESFDGNGPCMFWAFTDEKGTRAAWGAFQQWILSEGAHAGNCTAFLELLRKQNCCFVCSWGQKVLPLSCMKSQILDMTYKREILQKLIFRISQKKDFLGFFSLSSTQMVDEGSGKATWPLCRPTNLLISIHSCDRPDMFLGDFSIL